jgi:pre-mRNA-splicing helicase BRR2
MKEIKKEIESLLRRPVPMDESRFSMLVNIGKKITDFKTEEEKRQEGNEKIDEDLGISVVFDEAEDEEEEEEVDEVKDVSDEDVEGLEETKTRAFMIESKAVDDSMVDEDEEKQNELDVRTIDAYWLQRRLRTFYKVHFVVCHPLSHMCCVCV